MKTLFKRLKKGDFIVVLIIIVSATVLLLSVRTSDISRYADIYRNGEFITRYNLNANEKIYLDGLVLMIEQGVVYILEADCPDKICLNTGKIAQPHEMIVCLPKRIAIIISTDSGREGVDTIAK